MTTPPRNVFDLTETGDKRFVYVLPAFDGVRHLGLNWRYELRDDDVNATIDGESFATLDEAINAGCDAAAEEGWGDDFHLSIDE